MMLIIPFIIILLGPVLGLLLGKIASEELVLARSYLTYLLWFLGVVVLISGMLAFLRLSSVLVLAVALFFTGVCWGILFYQRRWGR